MTANLLLKSEYLAALGRRIERALAAASIQKQKAGEKAGVGKSAVSGWVTGTTTLDAYQLYVITEITGVSGSWILREEGEMFSGPEAAEQTLAEIRKLLRHHQDQAASEDVEVASQAIAAVSDGKT